MTTTPFYAGSDADFDGSDPGIVQPWPTVAGRFFLGNPQIMMVEIPSPMADGYTSPGTRGEVAHGLAGGLTAVTAWDSTLRAYTLPYQLLIGRDWQIIDGFYRRIIFGSRERSAGPWAFVPPEDTNRLTLAQSMCGALHGEVEGWHAFHGTLAYDDTVLPAVFPGGVMRWAGAIVSSVIVGGLTDDGSAVDIDHAAPYLPGMPLSAWVSAATASGTASARISFQGFAADGVTGLITINGPIVALATTPRQLAVTIDPGDLNAAGPVSYVAVQIECRTASAPDLLLSNPALDYVDEIPDDWAAGCGVPRVVWPVSRDRAVSVHRTSDTAMSLSETIWGAA